MVTYGGMSRKPVTVPTSAFIFKVSLCDWKITTNIYFKYSFSCMTFCMLPEEK